MVDRKISEETLRSSLEGSEEIRLAYDGGNYKATVNNISDFANKGSPREKLTADRVYYVRFNLGTCTMTIASPAVVTRAGHGLSAGNQIVFALPMDTFPYSGNSPLSISVASPCVITTASAHGYSADDPVLFRTTDTLPTGLTAGTTYYVRNPASTTFEVSATPGGASINTSGSPSGQHRVERASTLPTGVTEGQVYYVLAAGLTTDTFRFSATENGTAVNTSGSQAGKITLQTGNDNNTGLSYTQGEALMHPQMGVKKANLLDFNNRRVTVYLEESTYLDYPDGHAHIVELISPSASTDPLSGVTSAIGGGQLYVRGLNDNRQTQTKLVGTNYPISIVGFHTYQINFRKLAISPPNYYPAIRSDGPIGAEPLYLEHLTLLGATPTAMLEASLTKVFLHGMMQVIGNPTDSLFRAERDSFIEYIAQGLDYYPGVIAYGTKTPSKGVFYATRKSTVVVQSTISFTGQWSSPRVTVNSDSLIVHSQLDTYYGQDIPGTAAVVQNGGKFLVEDWDAYTANTSSALTSLKLDDDGTSGWGQFSRFAGNATLDGNGGSVTIGCPTGVLASGPSTPDYSVFGIDSANYARRGASEDQLNFFTAANRSRPVWWRTSTTGADDSRTKSTPVTANSQVFYWDFLAAHEESSGYWSYNGIGALEFSVDGTPAYNYLPSRFKLSINSGQNGYNTRLDLRADGTNQINSHIAYSAAQNTLVPVLQLQKATDNTPGVGTGIDVQFSIQTDGSYNFETGANIQVVSTDLTGASEDFDLRFKTMAGGVSAERLRMNNTGLLAPASTYFNFDTTQGSSGYGVRDNAGTIEFKNSGGTWIAPGKGITVTSDFSVTSSTTLVNVTGLSFDVLASHTYSFEAELFVTDAATGGVKAAIAGTATATAIQYTGYTIADNSIKAKTNATALATAVGSTLTTETSGIVVRITGTITVNAGGTLTVQMAQNTSDATATIAKRGSYFIVRDIG